MIVLHGELGAVLAEAAQRAHIAEQVGQRHEGGDYLGVVALVGALDLAAAGVQVADDVADVVFRRHHLDLHDRLEQLRRGLVAQFAEGGAGGDFEGQHAGVDVVIGAVDQRRLEVDHREAGQQAVFLGLRQALFDAGDVFLRHVAADDLALELIARAGFDRLEHDLDRANWPEPPVCFLWV